LLVSIIGPEPADAGAAGDAESADVEEEEEVPVLALEAAVPGGAELAGVIAGLDGVETAAEEDG
jgi:hypothetical protein